MYFRCIASFVSFCVFQSAAFRAWKKALLSQVKLFKPPFVHGTISIVQKMFPPTGFGQSFESNKSIAAHEFVKRFVKISSLISALLLTLSHLGIYLTHSTV